MTISLVGFGVGFFLIMCSFVFLNEVVQADENIPNQN